MHTQSGQEAGCSFLRDQHSDETVIKFFNSKKKNKVKPTNIFLLPIDFPIQWRYWCPSANMPILRAAVTCHLRMLPCFVCPWASPDCKIYSKGFSHILLLLIALGDASSSMHHILAWKSPTIWWGFTRSQDVSLVLRICLKFSCYFIWILAWSSLKDVLELLLVRPAVPKVAHSRQRWEDTQAKEMVKEA